MAWLNALSGTVSRRSTGCIDPRNLSIHHPFTSLSSFVSIVQTRTCLPCGSRSRSSSCRLFPSRSIFDRTRVVTYLVAFIVASSRARGARRDPEPRRIGQRPTPHGSETLRASVDVVTVAGRIRRPGLRLPPPQEPAAQPEQDDPPEQGAQNLGVMGHQADLTAASAAASARAASIFTYAARAS